MNYAKIKYFCIANGPGVRTALFVQGCPIHCKGCFNQDTWDFRGGKHFVKSTQREIFDSMNEHIAGLSILGGEPLVHWNEPDVTKLAKDFKQQFPDKTIWLWTGYEWDKVQHSDIMQYIDVCVAGPYVEETRDLSLAYCGSRNQEVIDVKATIKNGYKKVYFKET